MESEGESVWARLCEISDLIVGLKLNLEWFPANQYVIDNLEKERKELIRQWIRLASPYP